MDIKTRVLFGITTKSHTEIALDEMYGLQDLGYTCDQFEFGGKKNLKSSITRFFIIMLNTFNLLFKTYQFKPHFIYLNSRLEYLGSARDFVTIIIIKALYFRKVHFIIKSHGSDLEVLKTDFFIFKKIIFPYLKRYVRAWLFLSKEELNWITNQNLLNEETLFLTKNIVRQEKFKLDAGFRQKFNIATDTTILLFVGRIIKEKGIHYVIDAFATIKENRNVFLIIVGDGEELEEVKNSIERLNLAEKVLLTGWVNETEVAYYTANSDVLVFPTFFPEGFPMALFNSMAAGLSIITTPTRAAVDYLNSPDNCLWVEPKSSTSITIALNKLLDNKLLMQQMSLKNKIKTDLFTKKYVSNELSEILTNILPTINYIDTDVKINVNQKNRLINEL